MKVRIKKDNLSINYSWHGEHLLVDQKRETVFILEENSQGPYKNQLKSVRRIVENLIIIVNQIDSNLISSKSTKTKFNKNWVKDLYLASITPNNFRENIFEVNFEPINENESGYVSCLWNNDRIYEIESK